MTPKIYYVSWKTWLDQDIFTPWDFWFLQEGNSFRPRSANFSRLVPNMHMLVTAYQEQNQVLIDEIQNNFIRDVTLIALLEDNDPLGVQQQILKFFPDAEFQQTLEIDHTQRDQILELVQQSLTVNNRNKG